MPLPNQDEKPVKSVKGWPYVLALALIGSLLFAASVWWNLALQKEDFENSAITLARTNLEKDIYYRRWNAQLGGVYAPVGPHAQPNPYLKVPERDIETPSGRRLTLINPAYMTRQVHELESMGTGVVGHITSLNPIRPQNAPDPWERLALEKMHQGAKEDFEIINQDGHQVIRMLKPLYVEKPCLRCHAEQGYKIGEVRGGLSITVPIEALLYHLGEENKSVIITHLVFWAATMLAMIWVAMKLQRHIDERDQARQELRTLSGLLPICSHCKKIRDDQGDWQVLEEYIVHHSEADFSHGLCPDCLAKYYPDTYQRMKKENKI
ncbi:MAG: DUF3365 domain-containing protein [Deltaproteobacteria bacterium]|nr:DUF3365 domain-containing protein [Deltaproteobacteria bacterium]